MTTLIQDLPADWREGLFLGRLRLAEGPTPVLVRQGRVHDISAWAPTTAQAAARPDLHTAPGRDLGDLEALDLPPAWDDAEASPRLLSPVDLQCIKASGVTFAVSAVERVIEERARGDADKALAIREALADRVGADLSAVKPGSDQAFALKDALIADGLHFHIPKGYLYFAIAFSALVEALNLIAARRRRRFRLKASGEIVDEMAVKSEAY